MSDGFAIRRRGDQCEDGEKDCGATDKPYRACCPGGSFCPSQYNIDCCSSDRNCTKELNKEPRCADPTWDLYDNGGYFCCQSGLPGYNMAKRGSSGCASPGYTYEGGEKPLEPVKRGSSSSSDSEGGVPGGTIAGAVVGAVAGVALIAAAIWWFFLRKRRARRAEIAAAEDAAPGSAKGPVPLDGPPRELDPDGGAASAKPSELGAVEKPSELGTEREVAELGDGRKSVGKPLQMAGQHGISELPG